MIKSNFYLKIISLILAASSYLDCAKNEYIERGKARRSKLPTISRKFLDKELLIASTKTETSAQYIKKLIANGADVNTQSCESNGLAPIFWEITTNKNSTIQVADDFYNEMTGCTPLHNACLLKNINVVQELLIAGANVHLLNYIRHTPLHYAVLSPDTKPEHLLTKIRITKLLLDSNAKILTKNSDLPTPLDISIKTKTTHLQRLLHNTLFHRMNHNHEKFDVFENIILELSGKQ